MSTIGERLDELKVEGEYRQAIIDALDLLQKGSKLDVPAAIHVLLSSLE